MKHHHDEYDWVELFRILQVLTLPFHHVPLIKNQGTLSTTLASEEKYPGTECIGGEVAVSRRVLG
jgi:hypothetical protein